MDRPCPLAGGLLCYMSDPSWCPLRVCLVDWKQGSHEHFYWANETLKSRRIYVLHVSESL